MKRPYEIGVRMCRINFASFDNLYFALVKNVNLEMWVPKATVQKLLLSSIVGSTEKTSASSTENIHVTQI